MNIDNIKDIIAQSIPNTLIEVEGEVSLADKLMPSVDSARLWLESNYLGSDDFLSPQDNARAARIVALKAFALAIPSLDLVVTPTGFGIVSTESIAPASKDRIERLIASVNDNINSLLTLLLDDCRRYPQWVSSPRGSYFCSTFLSSLSDLRPGSFQFYDDLRSEALRVEAAIEENYLGKSLTSILRSEYNSGSRISGSLADYTHAAVAGIVYRENISFRDALWKYCRQLIERIPQSPEYHDIWLSEMQHKFPTPFKNDIKGSYFF